MDDLSAVRLSIQNDYPDLTAQEVDRLMNRKYKLDPERFDEDEIADSALQLKIDATKARKDISSLRDGFTMPVETATTQGEIESPFDESWYSNMQEQTSALEAVAASAFTATARAFASVTKVGNAATKASASSENVSGLSCLLGASGSAVIVISSTS